MLMGGQANGQASADGEQGPPFAWAEIQQKSSQMWTFLLEIFKTRVREVKLEPKL